MVAHARPLQLLFFTLALAAFSVSMSAQAQPATNITHDLRQNTIRTLADVLRKEHAVPETGRKAATMLVRELASGSYNSIVEGSELADRLTADLLKITGDKHLQVFFSAAPQQWIPSEPKTAGERKNRAEQERRDSAINNHGFKHLEILPSNIGYMKLDRLGRPAFAEPTLAAAMEFLSNTDGLIIDLRESAGGDHGLAASLMSYFQGPKRQHLANLRYRSGKLEPIWTLPRATERFESKDIYVLTSSRTFSAGEYIPYLLQALDRATIVGERTGGGAYAGQTFALNGNFAAWVSVAQPTVLATGSNWEGAGVVPDIAVPADQALERAQGEMLAKIAATLPPGPKRQTIMWTSERLRAQIDAKPLTTGELQAYTGLYGDHRVVPEEGKLIFKPEGGGAYPLLRISPDIFALVGYDPARIHFTRGGSGTISGMIFERDTGEKFPSVKVD